MKLNIKQAFKSVTGEVIKIKANEEGKDVKPEDRETLTLGILIFQVLNNHPYVNKRGFRPLKSYEIIKKCYGTEAKTDEIELEQGEIIQIREMVEENPYYNAVVTAQAIEMLDNAK